MTADQLIYLLPATRVKSATPRWAKMLAAARLGTGSQGRLAGGLAGGTRQLGHSILGAGAEGVAMKSFTPGFGESVIKQFYRRPIGASITDRAILMNAHPELFARVLNVNPSAERMVVERLQPIKHWDYSHVGAVEDKIRSSSREAGRGEFIFRVPGNRKLSVSDVRQANIGLDAAGRPKVLDPLVDVYRQPYNPLSKPVVPWLRNIERAQHSGSQWSIYRKPARSVRNHGPAAPLTKSAAHRWAKMLAAARLVTKSAAKWDKLQRAGKLSLGALRRIERSNKLPEQAAHLGGALDARTLNALRLFTRPPKPFKPLQEAARSQGRDFAYRQEQLMRRPMEHFPTPQMSAASEFSDPFPRMLTRPANTSKGIKLLQRLGLLKPRAPMDVGAKSTPRWLSIPEAKALPNFDAKEVDYARKGYDGMWGSEDIKQITPSYQPRVNTLAVDNLHTGASRHELGHFAQRYLATFQPEKLNVRTGIAARRLYKSHPYVAKKVFNTEGLLSGGDNIGHEFQAHMLAGWGGGQGGALRAINGPSFGPRTLAEGAAARGPSHRNLRNIVDGRRAWADNLYNSPKLQDRQDIAAAAVHTLRNYGLRL